ncbi:MAG: histone deacetylase [Verrucomicrobiales bacterium]|nr:histone deacetylase [Verrucomicrobiales bacterium]
MFPLWYSPIYTEGLDPEARFPRERYRLVMESLSEDVREGRLRFREAERMDPEDLYLVHDHAYVRDFLNGTLDDSMVRRIGLRPWTEAIVERTLILTGGTIEATRQAVSESGFAGNLGGGTHHAYRDFGSGYCIFNDLAVAAKVAQRDFGIRRVVILDLDVHQGDGTAAIFENDSSVTTVSFHCGKNFPFRKMKSDYDMSLDEGIGDSEYLDGVERFVSRELAPMEFDLLFFQGGVDALETDRLGHLSLSREGMMRRNELVLDFARAKGIPLVITMGGGYGEPIETSVAAHADLFRQASHSSPSPGDVSLPQA